MSLWTLLLIAVAVSADAFAVSLSKGLAMTQFSWRQASTIAIAFGGFQAGMIVLGWAVAHRFAPIVTGIDHWVAFGLLATIGTKMVWDAISSSAADPEQEESLTLREVLVLAIATSIDALAVGITFAFLDVDVPAAATLIGISTLLFSLAGVALGLGAGKRLGSWAEVVGGVGLVGIGTRILFSHLGLV